MPLTAVVTVPGLRVVSEMNARGHWRTRERRKAEQQTAVALALSQLGTDARDRLRSAALITVRFTRIGGRRLDTDNACSAFKFVRDRVAAWLQRSDAPGSGVEWELPPGQESGPVGVRIEFETLTEERK